MDFSIWGYWTGIIAIFIAAVMHFPMEFFAGRKLFTLVRLIAVAAVAPCLYTISNGAYWIVNYKAEHTGEFILEASGNPINEFIGLWLHPYWPYIAVFYGVAMFLYYVHYITDPDKTPTTLAESG